MEQEIKGGKCIVKLRLPAQYLREDATQEHKDSLEAYKTIATRLANDGFGAVVLPALTDTHGNYMFDMEIIKL